MRADLKRRIAKLEEINAPKGGRLHVIEYADGAKIDPLAFLRSKDIQATARDTIVCIRRFAFEGAALKGLPRYLRSV